MWSDVPNIKEHVIFGSEVPVGVAFEVLGRVGVESLQSLGCINIAKPFFKGHLVLEKAKHGLDVINGRSNDCNVPKILLLIRLSHTVAKQIKGLLARSRL